MLKILLGNLLFAGCVVGWYFYTDNDHDWRLPGTILAFGSFLSGILMGYLLRAPAKKKPARYRSVVSPFTTSPPTADEAETEEIATGVEAEQVAQDVDEAAFEPQIALEADPAPEPQPPAPIPAPLVLPALASEAVEIERFEQLPILVSHRPGLALTDTLTPVAVAIHRPPATVVVDSDGCYEMVAPSQPVSFIPAEEAGATEGKRPPHIAPVKTDVERSDFTI